MDNSLIPKAEQLVPFAAIDPNLPLEIIKAADNEYQRSYRYAMTSLVAGTALAVSAIGGFVYLVIQGHPASASALLAVSVLNFIGGFIRNRLREPESAPVPKRAASTSSN